MTAFRGQKKVGGILGGPGDEKEVQPLGSCPILSESGYSGIDVYFLDSRVRIYFKQEFSEFIRAGIGL